jgi:hypothetical protein
MSLERTAPRPAPAFTADEERPITGRPFLLPLYVPHFTAVKLFQGGITYVSARALRDLALKNIYCAFIVVDVYAVNAFVSRLITNGINRIQRVQPILILQVPDQKRGAFSPLRCQVRLNGIQHCRVI